MRQIVEEKATSLTYEQLSQEIVLGKLGSDIYNLAKKIAPLRHVGVRKSKVTSIPPGVIANPTEIIEQAKTAPTTA
jgi:small subunit ribosomal protein S3Ae